MVRLPSCVCWSHQVPLVNSLPLRARANSNSSPVSGTVQTHSVVIGIWNPFHSFLHTLSHTLSRHTIILVQPSQGGHRLRGTGGSAVTGMMEHQDHEKEDGRDVAIKDGTKHSSFRALKVALGISGNGLEKQVVGVIVPLFYCYCYCSIALHCVSHHFRSVA